MGDSVWRECELGDLLTLQRGFDLPYHARKPGRVPIVSSSGPSGFHSEAKCKAPGIVTGRYGTLGEVHFINEDYWPHNTALYVKDMKGNDPRFLYYLLSYTNLAHHNDKSGVPGVNRNDLHKIEVMRPPLPEQRSIARVLGGLDDKIELNRRMNRTLEDLARGLFRSWFVDFDPVVKPRGGPRRPVPLSPRDPPPTPWPARLVDSPLGPIPEGWRVCSLREEFNLTMGQSPPGSTYNEDGAGVPFYQGRTDFGFRFPTRRVYCTAPTRFAEPNDTLVSVRAPVGDINLADERCAAGRGVAAVRHKSGASSYTYAMMASMREAFDVFNGDGTLFGCIGKAEFDKMQVLVPPPALVEAFERIAGPWDAQIATNEKQARALAATRDALLPVLLSGEVRLRSGRDEDRAVRDAERAAGESLRASDPPSPAARRGASGLAKPAAGAKGRE